MPQMLAVGAIAGVILCLLALVMFFARWRYITDPQKFDSWRGLPVIACIPHSDSPAALLAFDAPDDLALQGIQSLHTAIDLMTAEGHGITIAMAGVADSVGTSFVSANLAAAMSDSGKRVLLVDADMTDGSLNDQLGVEQTPGFAELVAETCTMKQAIHSEIKPWLSLMTRGGPAAAPLAQTRFGAIAEQCRASYDAVIFDTSPVSANSDSAAIAGQCTLAFLIARSNRHTQGSLDAVIGQAGLERVKAKGLIFNAQKMATKDYREQQNVDTLQSEDAQPGQTP